jgi:hypothetical protein
MSFIFAAHTLLSLPPTLNSDSNGVRAELSDIASCDKTGHVWAP